MEAGFQFSVLLRWKGKEAEAEARTHTHRHTHAQCQAEGSLFFHTHIHSLPYLGLGLLRQTQLFWGEREKVGEGKVPFLSQLAFTHLMPGVFCNLARQKATWETKGHSKACSEMPVSFPFSSPPSPVFCCLLFCVWKDKLCVVTLQSALLSHSSLPLTWLGTDLFT